MSQTAFNFGGLPANYASYEKAGIVILPIPFDKTSTWIKGADKGPAAIIDASRNMELYDIETDQEVYKHGIYTAQALKANKTKELVGRSARAASGYLKDKKFVVVLGGEHSVSLGPIIAHKRYFHNISVLHLDAHSDRRDSYENDKFNHACVMARAQEYIDNIVSVGIRSMDATEKIKLAKDKIFFAHKIAKTKKWIPDVLSSLKQKKVYVTIDLDVFDSSVMPSTGTAEPGGLDWYQITNLLKTVARTKQIIGFDVVELCPNPYNKAPDFLAAKLVYTVLSYIF